MDWQKIAIGAGISALGCALALTASAAGGYARHSDGTISYEKTEFLKLTSGTLTEEQRKQISFEEFNAASPVECQKAGVACEETTEITVSAKKTWKPVKVAPLTSDALSSQAFGKYYDDLPAGSAVTSSSPAVERMTAQRILYETGLLPVLPTGTLGYQTELAAIRLQARYGLNEYDPRADKVVLGPKSVAKLNYLKSTLAAGTFDPATTLPSWQEGAPELMDRASRIKEAVASGTVPRAPQQPVGNAASQASTGNSLQMDGEVKIWKKE